MSHCLCHRHANGPEVNILTDDTSAWNAHISTEPGWLAVDLGESYTISGAYRFMLFFYRFVLFFYRFLLFFYRFVLFFYRFVLLLC